jgi:signal transduction histidine kinase
MSLSVRKSLAAIALLGVVTCLISSAALYLLIRTTNAQRVDRARDLVVQQLELISVADGATERGEGPALAIPTMLGMRGGVLARGASAVSISPPLDPQSRALLDRAIDGAANGSPSVAQTPTDDTTIIVGALRTERGSFAWMRFPVVVPTWIAKWQIVGVTLAIAGLALAFASLQLAVSVHRGASGLKASLARLGRDLAAPVARPGLRELADVADGIRSLAEELSRARAEEARLNRELADRERLATLGRVAAGVAHEVRNPLASIKLRLDLAQMEPDAPPALVHELASASTEIARLDRFVADLLTVSGRRTGPKEDIDLGALATRRVEVVEPWARERGVRISVTGTARALIDLDAVGRVVDNLVRNAVEASRPEGVVEVGVSNGGREVRVVVSDHGTGVEEARAHELFEPFFTTKPDGTGLGLAISRAIAQAHGGALTYSRDGDATRFELVLPAEGRA